MSDEFNRAIPQTKFMENRAKSYIMYGKWYNSRKDSYTFLESQNTRKIEQMLTLHPSQEMTP